MNLHRWSRVAGTALPLLDSPLEGFLATFEPKTVRASAYPADTGYGNGSDQHSILTVLYAPDGAILCANNDVVSRAESRDKHSLEN